MRKKLLIVISMVVLLTSLIASAPISAVPDDTGRTIADLAMFKASKFDAHLRTPNEAQIELLLTQEAVIVPGMTDAQVQSAIDNFQDAWAERNPDTPDPVKFQALLDKERMNMVGAQASQAETSDGFEAELAEESTVESQAVTTDTSFKSLVVPVEFNTTEETVTYSGPGSGDACVDATVTAAGPLHNEIAPPGRRDNNTVYYEDTTPALYDELYFGVGPEAGVIVHHPNLGDIDLRGSTMANYYLEQSEGAFLPTGLVYPAWLLAAHSEAWYGADSCASGSHNVRAQDLVYEVIDGINADDEAFAWQDFDGDGDGIVDNFTVIHAGAGQEAGGGVQGDFAIWSHASMIDWPSGYQACSAGSTGCPDRDIYVLHYSMDPENIDVGVISEEFGHAAFGLPDIYTTDAQGSPSNWAIMESGSWNGILGGMQPAPFPLWFRYIVGWANPAVRNYNSSPTQVVVGQLSQRPANTRSGVIVNLPNQVIEIPNPLDTGRAWWSDAGDVISNTITHTFDLTSSVSPILTFNSYWSIEDEYDYGFVEVSIDSGATWTTLPDIGGILTSEDPNNANDGWGLTSEGQGVLSFDLGDYAGQSILIRLRYTTDVAVRWDGWWVDDISIDDGSNNLYFADLEADDGGWTAAGWRLIPTVDTYPLYYLVEWRNLSGFDRGLAYPYQTVYSDEDEWQVDRSPYAVPGMLVWLRNAVYDFDYTLLDNSLYEPPSYGPKHALLIVDSHFYPHGWDGWTTASGGPLKVSGRVEPYDAAFTLQEIPEMTLTLGYDPATGEYLPDDDPQNPLQDTVFPAEPAVKQFHDSLGYYPGIYYSDISQDLWFWDGDASLAVPAKAPYTTRITDLNKDPLYDLYGADLGDTLLGSGNPGDNAAQYGLHIAIIRQDNQSGTWGKLAIWNSNQVIDLVKKVNKSVVMPGAALKYLLMVKNKTPVNQTFEVVDPLPDHTTYKSGPYYNTSTNSVVWTGTLPPYGVASIPLTVIVNRDTPGDVNVVNEAIVYDSAVGDTDGASTRIIRPAGVSPLFFTEESSITYIPFVKTK